MLLLRQLSAVLYIDVRPGCAPDHGSEVCTTVLAGWVLLEPLLGMLEFLLQRIRASSCSPARLMQPPPARPAARPDLGAADMSLRYRSICGSNCSHCRMSRPAAQTISPIRSSPAWTYLMPTNARCLLGVLVPRQRHLHARILATCSSSRAIGSFAAPCYGRDERQPERSIVVQSLRTSSGSD